MTIPVRRDGPPKGVPTYKPPAPKTESAEAYRERHRFYGRAAWTKQTRPAKLARDPLCERCLKQNILTPAQHVHHIQDLADRPDLAHDLNNLESLCPPCHSSETRQRMNAQRNQNGQA